MEEPNLEGLDDLQQFVLGSFANAPDDRYPIWVIAQGVCYFGTVISLSEKDQIFLSHLKEHRGNIGDPLPVVEEHEFQNDSAPQGYFDPEYIHLLNATIYVAGIVFQSTVTIYHAHVSAWGLGNPPIDAIRGVKLPTE